MPIRKTNVFEKGAASLINAIVVIILSLPLLFVVKSTKQWAILVVLMFFVYNVLIYLFFRNHCLGMRVVGTKWHDKYSFVQEIGFIFLYTLSFSTIFIWVWFPFDIFLINMALQVVCIETTGSTIHGYICGMYTIKHHRRK